jgi:tetratricopeptide (TPR) repeat protein
MIRFPHRSTTAPLSRRRPRLGRAATILILAVAGTVWGRDLPPAGDSWIELRTANFTLFSNAGESTTRRVALDLEELRAALDHLTTFELQSPIPTAIYVFKSQRSFTPYKTLYNGRPGDLAGYFLGRPHRNYIAITADSGRASEIVYHEYVHYVMDNNLWYLPPWLAEGLAEFYQTFEVVKDRVSIGLPNPWHLRRLQGRTLIPLSQLLEVGFDSPLYNESLRKSDFYAQSWAVTHYLLLGDADRRRQLTDYLARLREGDSPIEAFTNAFPGDLDTLDGEVRHHVRGPLMPSLQARAELEIDSSTRVRDLARADVLYLLGDLLSAQRPERPEAVRHFEAALEADPDHARAWSALALRAERRADWGAARAAHERAVASGTDDPLVLFRWAEFLRRRGSGGEQAVGVLRRVVQLDPSFAPAWAELATTYADLGSTSGEALAAAAEAHRLLPSDSAAADTYLRLCLRVDDRERATRIIETAFAGDRTRSAQAWTAVLARDLERAREELANGALDEARARITLAERDADRSDRPEVIRKSAAAARRAIDRREAASTYDRASRLYAAGEAAEARDLLTQVLRELPPDDPVAWSCRSLIQAIDAPPDQRSETRLTSSPTPDEIAELNHLLALDRLEEAVVFLTDVRERSDGPQRDWIEAKIGEIRWNIDYNRSVERYNLAVDLYNDGHYARAVSILERLLAEHPGGPHADAASRLLADARAAARSDP